MIVKVKLKKLRTDDGTFSVKDHVKLGAEYEIDLSTRRLASLYNYEMNLKHSKEIVDCTNGFYLPVEMLDLSKHEN